MNEYLLGMLVGALITGTWLGAILFVTWLKARENVTRV